MYGAFKNFLQAELNAIRQAGLYKEERAILGPQSAGIRVSYPEGAPGREVLNFCANNYLGLSSHPKVIAAARKALDSHGFGLSSVRFICGTQDIHKQLERRISAFLGTDDAILYTSCFDANGGLFETLLGEGDVVITDQLNHASIIDGIRLCKAKRLIYANNDMADLERKLKEAAEFQASVGLAGAATGTGAAARPRVRMIATDGAFSMDGSIAQIDRVCDLADRHNALVMVDDSHCTGFLGRTGRGSAEHCGAMGRVDVITSTLGKALGGASGGFTTGRQEIIDLLRQRSRPYLFSNTLAPMIVQSSIAVLDLLSETTELRDKLEANTRRFRAGMTAAGFDVKPGVHPIVPIMLYNARLAQDVARDLYQEGIYVVGFFFPVVGKGLARIRVQLSAAHEASQVDRAVEAFTRVGRKYEILGKSRHEIVARYGE